MKNMEKAQKDFQHWKKQRERELMTLRRQVNGCKILQALKACKVA